MRHNIALEYTNISKTFSNDPPKKQLTIHTRSETKTKLFLQSRDLPMPSQFGHLLGYLRGELFCHRKHGHLFIQRRGHELFGTYVATYLVPTWPPTWYLLGRRLCPFGYYMVTTCAIQKPPILQSPWALTWPPTWHILGHLLGPLGYYLVMNCAAHEPAIWPAPWPPTWPHMHSVITSLSTHLVTYSAMGYSFGNLIGHPHWPMY